MGAAPGVSALIRVGTAGWSYADWNGIVYPRRPGRGFDPLAMMASLFDTNEINSSFYRIPDVRSARGWARRVSHNPQFAFTAKLFRGFTHERTAGSAEERDFLSAMEPLADAGRLSEILVQFPVSFRNTPENRGALDALLSRFDRLPLAAEFRHASWDDEAARAVLDAHRTLFVNIDQPWIGDNLRRTDRVAAGRAYYRFHGRNAEKWFGPDTSNEQRYDYLYSAEQLDGVAGRLGTAAAEASSLSALSALSALSGQSGQSGQSGPSAVPPRPPAAPSGITAILNNHFRGQAVANAIELQYRLTGEILPVPDTLREAYPAIRGITSGEGQAGLF